MTETYQRERYYVRTIRYHVWGVFRRTDRNMDGTKIPESAEDTMIESIGARGIGDDEARKRAANVVAKLNRSGL